MGEWTEGTGTSAVESRGPAARAPSGRRDAVDAWLHGIARTLAIDHFRAGETSGEEEALRILEGEGVREQMALLPAPQREVLTLKFVCGLSNAEAAVVLGTSEGAVKGLQHGALLALRRSGRAA